MEDLLTEKLDHNEIKEMDSLCMKCYKQGTTRILVTKIPFFKNIVIMSFSCDHCHFKNNEIQSANKLEKTGIKYSLKIT